jgi:hypothetical protein
MRSRLFVSIFLAAFACSMTPAFAVEAIPDSSILRKLGAENFRDREEAQAKLLEWGKERPDAAMTWLHGRMMSETDPELRRRFTAVLRELVLEDYRRNGNGYIGIFMMPVAVKVPGDQGKRFGIGITNLVPDSAGAKAGLAPGDVIIAAGGTSWKSEDAMELFQRQIRGQKPGFKMELKVLRKNQEIDVSVILERRPVGEANRGPFAPAPDLARQKKKEEDADFEKWLKDRIPSSR